MFHSKHNVNTFCLWSGTKPTCSMHVIPSNGFGLPTDARIIDETYIGFAKQVLSFMTMEHRAEFMKVYILNSDENIVEKDKLVFTIAI